MRIQFKSGATVDAQSTQRGGLVNAAPLWMNDLMAQHEVTIDGQPFLLRVVAFGADLSANAPGAAQAKFTLRPLA